MATPLSQRANRSRTTQPPVRPKIIAAGISTHFPSTALLKCLRTAAYGASGVAEQEGYKEPSVSQQVAFAVRAAEPRDFWPVADVHCSVFYPRARPSAARIIRLDRVLGMQTDTRMAELGQGRAAVLMATTRAAAACPDGLYPPLPGVGGPVSWARAMFDANYALEGLGTGSTEAGVLGSACLDSFCDKIPPKAYCETQAGMAGRVGWALRSGLAYISNVAVISGARRNGVAAQLVASAEQLAAEWGCRAITLHVDPANLPAYRLYIKLGYRKAVQEPAWLPYLAGRPEERRWLMYKRLPTR